LLTGILLIATSFFILKGNNTVDLHYHDTYFVIAHTHVFWLLAIGAFVLWTIYLLTEKRLYSKTLSWLHITITILMLLMLAISLYLKQGQSELTPRRYSEYGDWDSFMNLTRYDKILFIAIAFILIAQLFFVFNFIIGLFKRKV